MYSKPENRDAEHEQEREMKKNIEHTMQYKCCFNVETKEL